jgi:hypothetical protein
MFRLSGNGAVVAAPFLSLEHRIGLVRKRRRMRLIKQLALVIGPVLGSAVVILLIAAGGAISAGSR